MEDNMLLSTNRLSMYFTRIASIPLIIFLVIMGIGVIPPLFHAFSTNWLTALFLFIAFALILSVLLIILGILIFSRNITISEKVIEIGRNQVLWPDIVDIQFHSFRRIIVLKYKKGNSTESYAVGVFMFPIGSSVHNRLQELKNWYIQKNKLTIGRC